MKAEQLKKISDAANGKGILSEMDSILSSMARAAKSGKYSLRIEYAHKDKIRTNLFDLGFKLTEDDNNSCTVSWGKDEPRVIEAQPRFGDEVSKDETMRRKVTERIAKDEKEVAVRVKKLVKPKPVEIELIAEAPVIVGSVTDNIRIFVEGMMVACQKTVHWGENGHVIIKNLSSDTHEEYYCKDRYWFNIDGMDVDGMNNSAFTALIMNTDRYNR